MECFGVSGLKLDWSIQTKKSRGVRKLHAEGGYDLRGTQEEGSGLQERVLLTDWLRQSYQELTLACDSEGCCHFKPPAGYLAPQNRCPGGSIRE